MPEQILEGLIEQSEKAQKIEEAKVKAKLEEAEAKHDWYRFLKIFTAGVIIVIIVFILQGKFRGY